jgi:hypothetical protein
MPESNPPRNSQLETHREDEGRGGRRSAAPPAGFCFGGLKETLNRR